MQDADSDVRLAVAQALGAVGNPVAIEKLVLAMTDEERTVRDAAGRALDQIDVNWHATEAAQRAAAQLESSLQDKRAWVCSAAMQVLNRLRSPDGQIHLES
jgi:HEAT repeat protein